MKQMGKRRYNGIARSEYTPDFISSLKADEIFVFGSNLQGNHGGGAARAARLKFGAVMGKGVGLQGQSYAIPTMQGGVATIKPYVDQFITFAKKHTELFFYITRIGCGIAGFKDEDIAPLFAEALEVENICLPESFARIISEYNAMEVPEELMTMMYGQIHTLLDLLKELNYQKPITSADDASTRLTELVSKNVRYGDTYAFMAIRALWSLISYRKGVESAVDLEQLEKDMLSYHNENKYFNDYTIKRILYNYSVRKMIKYIQFLNDFRRYKNYNDISDDLRSIPFSHCSKNDPNYYFSFSGFAMYSIKNILSKEWDNLTKNGKLDNKALEKIAVGRFNDMVKTHGLKQTLRLAYTDVGCHPDIQEPKQNVDNIIWGPFFRIEGNHIEKGCADFIHWPLRNTTFEMQFAKHLLDTDNNYVFIDWRGGLYIPKDDYSLPLYSILEGKMYFESDDEKIKFIERIKSGYNAD